MSFSWGERFHAIGLYWVDLGTNMLKTNMSERLTYAPGALTTPVCALYIVLLNIPQKMVTMI